MAADPTIARVTRRYDAPPERVFDAWLDVRLVRRWFGPGLGPVVCVDIDARVDGEFMIVQRRGDEEVEHTGSYLAVERPTRLAFTWRVPPTPETSRVDIDIVPVAGGCELTLAHELAAAYADMRERVAASWARMLDEMAAVLQA